MQRDGTGVSRLWEKLCQSYDFEDIFCSFCGIDGPRCRRELRRVEPEFSLLRTRAGRGQSCGEVMYEN